MKRLALIPLVFFAFLTLAPAASAQTSKATAKEPVKKDAVPAVSAAPAPVSEELLKMRMKPPIKGTASVEFIPNPVKIVNGEVQGTIRVKNVDTAPIIGLRIDEYFYAGQKEVSACTARVRNPVAAGEVVDVPISCPNPKEKSTANQLFFSHANGKVTPKMVKKFTGDTTSGTAKKQ